MLYAGYVASCLRASIGSRPGRLSEDLARHGRVAASEVTTAAKVALVMKENAPTEREEPCSGLK